MSKEIANLFDELLPAIYRIHDDEQGKPLQSLMSILAKQAGLVEEDIAKLYDNWFIETCDEWVVPYIGDLLNVRGIHPVSSTNFTMRAYVAHTLAYRRRKGTVTVLEQLGHDVSGWRVKAVEFFKLLITNQNVNHVRLDNPATIGLRDGKKVLDKKKPLNNNNIGLENSGALEMLGGPFEQAAHTIEIRSPSTFQGKYNIPNIGLFLWRLQSYRVSSAAAHRVSDGCYTFSPLGNDIPIFNLPQTESLTDYLTDEKDVPGVIRPRAFQYDLQEYSSKNQDMPQDNQPENTDYYYGPKRSLSIYKDGDLVYPQNIVAKSLCQWERPNPGKVAVDVTLGRLAFALDESPAKGVLVDYTYGFSGDIGGGPYNRQGSVSNALARKVTWQKGVSKDTRLVDGRQIFSTLAEAIDKWNELPAGTIGVITIMDSSTYDENSGAMIEITVPENSQLMIVAANWPLLDDPDGNGPKVHNIGQVIAEGLRPHLIADILVKGSADEESLNSGVLILNGLLIQGTVNVAAGSIGSLQIAHCTFVPGSVPGILPTESRGTIIPLQASISVDASNDWLSLEIDHSIVGPLKLPKDMECLIVKDCIIDGKLAIWPNCQSEIAIPAIAASGDGTSPGPKTILERTTVFGKVNVKELELASEAIFNDPVVVVRHQAGCVRFSFVPEGSSTPHRYRCQPDLALENKAEEDREAGQQIKSVADLPRAEKDIIIARVRPEFTSRHYGDPGYAQLSRNSADEIYRGAEDGSEMGVFCSLKQPQREANMASVLDEYLRIGLEVGLFFVN